MPSGTVLGLPQLGDFIFERRAVLLGEVSYRGGAVEAAQHREKQGGGANAQRCPRGSGGVKPWRVFVVVY